MSEHDDGLYLAHIEEAIGRIERSSPRLSPATLESDETLRDATLFRLQTLAESTQRLSSDFKEKHPEITWEQIAGFRNRVVHGYLDVRSDIVWAIVERDLPKLARCIREEVQLRNRRSHPGPERDTGSGSVAGHGPRSGVNIDQGI